MTKRRWNLLQRRARWVQGNRHYRGMAEDVFGEDLGFTAQDGSQITPDSPQYQPAVHRYRDWLMASATKQGRGRKMHRALVRAEQKYNKLKREHRGTSRLRQDYPRRWR